MSDAQYASTRTELTALAALAALAARLPAHLSLTAPATWAQYASATPTYAEDIVSCPHIADRLGNALGGRWTWFLTSGGGVHQPHGRPADGLLALIDAASRSYS